MRWAALWRRSDVSLDLFFDTQCANAASFMTHSGDGFKSCLAGSPAAVERCCKVINDSHDGSPWLSNERSSGVAHRFDIVSIRIEHEGAIITGVIMRAEPGGAIVASACGKRCVIKCIDGR